MAGKPNDKIIKTLIAKHGSIEAVRDWYREIGRKGGRMSKTGGFASNKVGKDGLTGLERARVVGVVGGRRSQRGKSKRS